LFIIITSSLSLPSFEEWQDDIGAQRGAGRGLVGMGNPMNSIASRATYIYIYIESERSLTGISEISYISMNDVGQRVK
jgi:hypothetical protein